MFLHLCNKADALAGHRAYDGLRRTAVANRSSSRIKTGGNRRIGDDPTTPNRGNQVIPTDDPAAVSQEVDEEVEDLRFDRNLLATPTQFVALNIQKMFAKFEPHNRLPTRPLRS
jgi:hypothetical protein